MAAIVGMLWFEKGLEAIGSILTEGDVVDEQVRQVLTSKLDDIKESLDVLRKKEFKAAKLQIKSALSLCQAGVDATAEFHKARSNAEMAMGAVKSINDKIEASKMASMCAVYESGCDMIMAQTLATNYINHVLNMKEIRATFDVIYGSGLVNKFRGAFGNKSRDSVLANFYSFTTSLNKYLNEKGVSVTWPYIREGDRFIVHPLTIIPSKERIIEGNACDCENTDVEYIPHYKYEVYMEENEEGDEEDAEDAEEGDGEEGDDDEAQGEPGDEDEDKADGVVEDEVTGEETESNEGREREEKGGRDEDDDEENSDKTEKKENDEDKNCGDEEEKKKKKKSEEPEDEEDNPDKDNDEVEPEKVLEEDQGQEEADDGDKEEEEADEEEEEVEEPAAVLRVLSFEDGEIVKEITTDANMKPISTGGYCISFKLVDPIIEAVEIRDESSWDLVSTLDMAPLSLEADTDDFLTASLRGGLVTIGVGDCLSVWDIQTETCLWNLALKFPITDIAWECDKHLLCTREYGETFTVQMFAAE